MRTARAKERHATATRQLRRGVAVLASMTIALEADFGDVGVAEFHFDANYRQPEVDPPNPYVAVILEGGLTKSFRARSFVLDRGATVAIPEAAAHSARMGTGGAKEIAVGPISESACAFLRLG